MDRTFMPTGLPTIPRLHQLALKKIFDKLTSYEEAELSMGIEKHMQIVTHLTEIDREQLHRIVDSLMADEELDYFSKQKFWIKKAKIDYRKLYSNGLPYLDLYRPIPA
jgi:hypothetical protein